LLFWETDGYSLDEAKARAAQLAAQHVPAIRHKNAMPRKGINRHLPEMQSQG